MVRVDQTCDSLVPSVRCTVQGFSLAGRIRRKRMGVRVGHTNPRGNAGLC